MNDKQIKLQHAIESFHQSNKNARDYFGIFHCVAKAIKQGSGLTWEEVKEAIETALNIQKSLLDEYRELAGLFHMVAGRHPPENFRGCTHEDCVRHRAIIKRFDV